MFIEKIDNLCLEVDSKRPKTKCQKQNTQDFKMSNVSKSPKQQKAKKNVKTSNCPLDIFKGL